MTWSSYQRINYLVNAKLFLKTTLQISTEPVGSNYIYFILGSHLLLAVWWLQAHGWCRPLQTHRTKRARCNIKYMNKTIYLGMLSWWMWETLLTNKWNSTAYLFVSQVWVYCSYTVVCQKPVICITDLSDTDITCHNFMFYLTQMEGGIPQTVSLVGVSAVAQQQLHWDKKWEIWKNVIYGLHNHILHDKQINNGGMDN